MVTKVPYLLHARADEDLRSGPLTATDTRQDLVPAVRTEERRGQATFPDLPLAAGLVLVEGGQWGCRQQAGSADLATSGIRSRPCLPLDARHSRLSVGKL
jgi:hypothetical protein